MTDDFFDLLYLALQTPIELFFAPLLGLAQCRLSSGVIIRRQCYVRMIGRRLTAVHNSGGRCYRIEITSHCGIVLDSTFISCYRSQPASRG